MMPRSLAEIRAEIAHQESTIRERRLVHTDMRAKGDRATARERIEGASASIGAAGAAIIIGALTWALGETASPTTRVKVQ